MINASSRLIFYAWPSTYTQLQLTIGQNISDYVLSKYQLLLPPPLAMSHVVTIAFKLSWRIQLQTSILKHICYLRPWSRTASKTEPEEQTEKENREVKWRMSWAYVTITNLASPLPEPSRTFCFLDVILLKPRPQEFLTWRVIHIQVPGVPQNYSLNIPIRL